MDHHNILKYNTYNNSIRVYYTHTHNGIEGGLTWTSRTAVPRLDGGTLTLGNGTRDQGTHLPVAVAIAVTAAIVPALTIVVMQAIHGQTRALTA